MNRGTKKSDPPKTPIVGEDFKEKEDERLEESGVKFITSGRGTSKIPVEKTKTSKKKKYTGRKSSNRGTSSQ